MTHYLKRIRGEDRSVRGSPQLRLELDRLELSLFRGRISGPFYRDDHADLEVRLRMLCAIEIESNGLGSGNIRFLRELDAVDKYTAETRDDPCGHLLLCGRRDRCSITAATAVTADEHQCDKRQRHDTK